ncbi:aldo/keto reductase [Streptomyces sp. ADMS]|uniref:aldo/keto reductase n=1 Tax=Streptomyces sp. ADMS TaxID=3071415 RepID=UPI00296E9515|nr:aldo/keto reductase [Streptomyces sp. ADMS]MDW4910793.1 aldo/keto reductase [Streptomyces sp. ADMS]
MSDLCLGSMYFGTRVDSETSMAILDRFLEAGGNFIDTANTYAFWEPGANGEESETLIGHWLKSRRAHERVVISTKAGARPSGPGEWPANAEGLSGPVLRDQLKASLQRLGVDRIGIYYAHIEDRSTPVEETAQAFARLVEEGLMAVPGCSNYPAWRIAESREAAQRHGWPDFRCVQQMHTYLQPLGGGFFPGGGQRYTTDELLDYGRAHPEFTLLAYSPLLSGAYTREERTVPDFYRHPGLPQRMRTLMEVAAELGATPNQVVLAWMMQSEPAWLPVLGVSSVAQLDECLGALDLVLSEDTRIQLDQAGITSAA